jgi:hypothetical protein
LDEEGEEKKVSEQRKGAESIDEDRKSKKTQTTTRRRKRKREHLSKREINYNFLSFKINHKKPSTRAIFC